jgi:2-dehydro-3-deoxyglucarate aldolase/4-hydroxy-2-oxoheptanedioate aldolase
MMRVMRENPVKRKLAAGGTSIGLIVGEFTTIGIGRIAAGAGADFVMVDMEHGGIDIVATKNILAAAGASGIVPLVRVPSTGYHLISQPLDAGAVGVMVPMVESADQAREVINSAKYPPLGGRGVGPFYADDVEQQGLAATLAKANEELLLIAQIETVTGVEHVEEIAAVDGIDVLWIGHFDLTTSLGTPGEFWNAGHTEAVDRVFEACRRHGKTVATMANDVPDALMLAGKGFRMFAFNDAMLFAAALHAAVQAI